MAKITLRDGTVIEGTSEEIAELAERLIGEEVEGDPEPKTVDRSAEVGERILITNAYMSDGKYNNGDILTVVSIGSNDEEGVNVDANGMKAYVLHNEYEVIVEDEDDEVGYPRLDQVKLVRKAEDIEEVTKEFNVGDYAKVVGETYHGDILTGEIVKIYREKDVDGDYRIDLEDGSDYDYAQADSLEHYEPSDRELSFLQSGRDIDEFKAGDIAEVEFSPNAHPVGALVRVTGTRAGNGVYAKGMVLDVPIQYSYRTHNLKLVATAESRVDIDA